MRTEENVELADGLTLMHEHLCIDLTPGDPGTRAYDLFCQDLCELKQRWGVGNIVDLTNRTGAVVSTHTSRGCQGVQQAEYLIGRGIDPGKIVIGHSEFCPGGDTLEKLLDTACASAST